MGGVIFLLNDLPFDLEEEYDDAPEVINGRFFHSFIMMELLNIVFLIIALCPSLQDLLYSVENLAATYLLVGEANFLL